MFSQRQWLLSCFGIIYSEQKAARKHRPKTENDEIRSEVAEKYGDMICMCSHGYAFVW